MCNNRPYPINNLFSDTTEVGCLSLSKIKQRAIMLHKLNYAVNELLSAALRPWCRVANIRQGVIVLEIANASWKMRLRYEQPQLLSVLRAQIIPSLSSIDIKINPSLARKQKLNTQNNNSDKQYHQLLWGKPRQLGVQSAAYIRHVATYSKGELKNTLERLAKLAEENTNPIYCRK